MNWFKKTLTSSIGRKLVMAFTGLFLCSFLVVHVAGNFQLFKNDEGLSFNTYTVFMTHNPVIKTISYLLYASILIHSIQSLIIVLENRKARRKDYYMNKPQANSKWSSRNMGLLGSIILFFLVVHMKEFWAEYKWGNMPKADYTVLYKQDGEQEIFSTDSLRNQAYVMNLQRSRPELGNEIYKNERIVCRNLYAEVKKEFENEPLSVLLYVIAMIALSFHLIHGFQSAFRSIGVTHKKYLPLIKSVGWFFAVIIPAAFAAMPLYFFLMK